MQQRRQSAIPNIFVMPRHRSWFDLSREAIAHHNFVSFAPFFHESRHFAEVVAIVRITHDDERTARRANSGFQRRSVAALRHGDHPCTKCFRDFDRPVRRTVIRNHNFAAQSRVRKCFLRFLHADSNGIRFIQAWNHHRNVDRTASDVGHKLGGQLRLERGRALCLHHSTSCTNACSRNRAWY